LQEEKSIERKASSVDGTPKEELPQVLPVVKERGRGRPALNRGPKLDEDNMLKKAPSTPVPRQKGPQGPRG